MIPLVHDLSEATVVVFGGGPVGARKARRFAREARVVVVSPTFADEPFGGAELVRADPDARDVGGWLDRFDPALVVATTDDDAVNDAIGRAASDRGVLVNRADVRGPRSTGSVVVPATVRDGPVVVAVSTEGTAPALSRAIRERLEETIAGSGRVAGALVAVDADLRPTDLPADRRRALLNAVASAPDVWTAARSGGDVDAAAARVMADTDPA